ncbi:tRNA (adenosine(37)-N6)-threonylcarbamoyltransferase complex dimerization subunit type 1 TsaB [Sphingomonas soli]|uniref:tRNA (adenosine(37)-N6)-threonylcarbamoyltransferase complex dimerization subunit type 1 TsaB n=1 Tax=Sphingomonas soli TaxID=266127 RepID=UPI00082FEAFD|nr:tRNA (adenosine(37)-N6)-threonylcarbamoyltransferase complex dimerization subunit type 1 TsaB [Sphingomonas soli]
MRTLVIETATAACSVALIESGRVIANAHEIVERGHAERLIPMIAALPGEGRADGILVDVGPGSFTGVRVGLAAAIGLGIGRGVPVQGYSSLALLAATAFARDPALARLAVVLEGGHGEVFMQIFHASPFGTDTPLRSLTPSAAIELLDGLPAIGSGVRRLAQIAPSSALAEAWPDAADAVSLPPAFAALPASPIYGRAPDAKTLAERGLA